MRKRRKRGAQQVNGMAMTSMILGIVAVVFGIPGCVPHCCCWPMSGIAIICGGIAAALGFMGRTPGSESFALTGIITGFIGLALGLLGVVGFFLIFVLRVGALGFANLN